MSKDDQYTFDTLKYKFTTLVPPNFDHPYIIETDSCNFTIVAILSQRLQSDNSVHPTTFYSLSLIPEERNYSIYNKESLPIIDFLEKLGLFIKRYFCSFHYIF